MSRVNQKVLHLDANDYYGSSWASFNIKDFDAFMKDENEPIVHTSKLVNVIIVTVLCLFLVTESKSYASTVERGYHKICCVWMLQQKKYHTFSKRQIIALYFYVTYDYDLLCSNLTLDQNITQLYVYLGRIKNFVEFWCFV